MNKCSFCGQTERQVRLLISGLNGFICDDCSLRAAELVNTQLGIGDTDNAEDFDFDTDSDTDSNFEP